MAKAFDAWNIIKKRIDLKNSAAAVFFYEREVWWCSVGINVGVESDGKHTHFERPVLIIRKFNGHMLWMVPLTSRQHDGVHFYRISHDRGASFACLSQLKTISSKRLLRKIGMIAENEFEEVCERVAGYIKNRAPR